MKQTGKFVGLCLLVLLGSTLSACGKKGPLYLPPDKLAKTPTLPVAIEDTASESDNRKKTKDSDKLGVTNTSTDTLIETPQP